MNHDHDLGAAEQYVRSEADRRGWRTVAAAHSEALALVLAEYDRRGTELADHVRADIQHSRRMMQRLIDDLRAERDSLRSQVAAVRALADDPGKIAAAMHRVCEQPADYVIGFACASAANHSMQAAEAASLLLAVLGGPAEAPAADEQHRYLSAACLHHDHGYCQSPDGYDADGDPFRRRPSQCKFCAAPCVCSCHSTSVGPAEAAEPADDPLVEAPGFGVTNREYWPLSQVKAAEEAATGQCGICEIDWRLCRGLYDQGLARCCSDCTHDLHAKEAGRRP